jgi:hypothetical protein
MKRETARPARWQIPDANASRSSQSLNETGPHLAMRTGQFTSAFYFQRRASRARYFSSPPPFNDRFARDEG